MFFKATSSSNRVEKGLMQQFAARLEESLGLNYSEKDWESLERKMDGAAKDFGCSDGKSCIQRLALQALSPEQVVLLAKHLTIGETYFFRDTPLFETLRTKLFPALIEKRREEGKFLRIWSAACCSGEEPYSLAILLNELIPDIADWTIWLMGSDINPNFIKKAEKGVYKQWSFRSTPSEIQKKYFRLDSEGCYEIAPKIKKMVKFIKLNLIEGVYPSESTNTQEMDFIFCNNVLIYFSEAQITKTVGKLTDSLNDGGYLIVSPTEVPYIQNDKLVHQTTEAMTFFLKGSQPVKEIAKKLAHPKPIVPPANVLPRPLAKVIKQKKQITLRFQEQYEQGHYQEIAEWADKATKEELQRCKIAELTAIARSYANIGQVVKAKSLMEIVLQEEKLDPELHFFYGTLLEESALPQEAIKSYKRALFLDHSFVLAYYALGNLLWTQGDEGESLRNFRNALHLLETNRSLALYETKGITAELIKEIIASHQKTNSSNK